MKKLLTAAALFSAIVFAGLPAQASLVSGGNAGKPVQASHGGENASPVGDVVNQTESAAATSQNTAEIADNTNKTNSILNSLHESMGEQQKANQAYTAAEQRDSHFQQAGKDARAQIAQSFSLDSKLAASTLAATSTGGGLGADAGYKIFAGWPKSDVGKDGKGGTTIEAVELMKEMGKVKDCLPKYEGEQMAQKYGAQGSDKGLCLTIAGMKALPKGIQVGPGKDQTKIVAAQLSMIAFGERVNVMSAALGYTPRQLVQAEVKQYFAAKQGKHLAIYKSDGIDWDNLLIKTTGRNAAEDANMTISALGKAWATDTAKSALLHCYSNHFSIPNQGQDTYKEQAEQSKAATGEEPCYAQGSMRPSALCQARLAEGAAALRGAAAANQKGNGVQLASRLSQAIMEKEAAQNRAMAASQDSCSGTGGQQIYESLKTVAMIWMMPEFHVFVASLDDKTLKEIDKRATEMVASIDPMVERNYAEFLHERGPDATAFASNDLSPSLGQLFSVANVSLDAAPAAAQAIVPVSYNQNSAAPMQATPISTSALPQ